MALDRSYISRNCASTDQMRELVEHLSNEELLLPVAEHWTISSTLAHLAFWDLRVLHLLDATERNGGLIAPEIDIGVNDIALPL